MQQGLHPSLPFGVVTFKNLLKMIEVVSIDPSQSGHYISDMERLPMLGL
jgi:hypothetical protein